MQRVQYRFDDPAQNTAGSSDASDILSGLLDMNVSLEDIWLELGGGQEYDGFDSNGDTISGNNISLNLVPGLASPSTYNVNVSTSGVFLFGSGVSNTEILEVADGIPPNIAFSVDYLQNLADIVNNSDGAFADGYAVANVLDDAWVEGIYLAADVS